MSFARGDVVQVKYGAKVRYNSVPTDAEFVDLEDDRGEYLGCVPTSKVTLIKKASPKEPPMGTVIHVDRGYDAPLWVRRVGGWYRLTAAGENRGIDVPINWSDFGHDALYVYGPPVKLT